MKFAVTYDETLARTFIVEADTWYEAEDIVLNAVESGDITLSFKDYLESNIMSAEATDYDEKHYRTIDECINSYKRGVYPEENYSYERNATPKEITIEKYNKLFDMWENNNAPQHVWYIHDDGVYTGIDNYDGEFFVESFYDKDDCMRWLQYEDVAADELDSHIG